ncbi:hypothetical protein NIES37_60830 [Tolypothrix tenuis PCC 7101]|uniref:Uncharacterized protein n=1 Tax=Tolypothrix tenuis PCC 7101 TaxID=231146 RepID=A0A1Z4N8R4_9CYAN|nr:hypothetical protein NIES37_60830 [Tolypothrix tenuis PCC 7101]BAZ74002.1 hypothetical protein NIES50_25720 [Aulosira laxa NIES-50]
MNRFIKHICIIVSFALPIPLLKNRNVSLHPLGMQSLSSDAFVRVGESNRPNGYILLLSAILLSESVGATNVT